MKKMLFLCLLFVAGCMPTAKPIAVSEPITENPYIETPPPPEIKVEDHITPVAIQNNTISLQTFKINENASLITGHGSAFAVAPNIVITALHNLNDTEFLSLNGALVAVKKKYAFGTDGLLLVVDGLSPDVPIVDVTTPPARGGKCTSTGFCPTQKRMITMEGIITSDTYCTILFRPGMSGGIVSKDGKAFGTISAFNPDAGIGRFEPLDLALIKRIIAANPCTKKGG